jgi:UDP-sugar pyrophosphorylase
VCTIAAPRRAKDTIGAVTRLVQRDGTSSTIAVECNQLEPLLLASGYPGGDANRADGFSPFVGNINQLIMSLPPYVEVLERTGGLVPEFVNPKYADESKTVFKKPTRLECMMQDHFKVVPPGSLICVVVFPEWTYSPVKNDPVEALAKVKKGVPGRSMAEGEMDFYDAQCRRLAAAGVAIPKYGSILVQGFTLALPPRIVLHPNFAPTQAVLASRFPDPAAISISQRSTLIIEGPDVRVEGLELDGTFVVKACAGAFVTLKKGLKVINAGWSLEALSSNEAGSHGNVSVAVAIRGFQSVRTEARTLEFTSPGSYDIYE